MIVTCEQDDLVPFGGELHERFGRTSAAPGVEIDEDVVEDQRQATSATRIMLYDRQPQGKKECFSRAAAELRDRPLFAVTRLHQKFVAIPRRPDAAIFSGRDLREESRCGTQRFGLLVPFVTALQVRERAVDQFERQSASDTLGERHLCGAPQQTGSIGGRLRGEPFQFRLQRASAFASATVVSLECFKPQAQCIPFLRQCGHRLAAQPGFEPVP